MALDNFLVQDPLGRPFSDVGQLNRLRTAVEEALVNRQKMTSRLSQKPLARSRAHAFRITPMVLFDNDASNRFTVVEVNAQDRPALLQQLAQTLFDGRVVVHSAHIATYGERAVDTFYVTDLTGEKITSRSRIRTLETRLEDAAAGEVAAKAG
jgi:[protein-PII] uridylyltransferase